jgi:hypothetical protein
MNLLKRSALLSVCTLLSWNAQAQTRPTPPKTAEPPTSEVNKAEGETTAPPSKAEESSEAKPTSVTPKESNEAPDSPYDPPLESRPDDAEPMQPLGAAAPPPREGPNPYQEEPNPYQDQAASQKAPKKEVDEIDPSTLPFTYHQRHFDLGLGVKVQSARDNALQPFVENEVLGAFFVRGGGVVWTSGPLALAVNAELNTTTVNSNVRSESSRLNLTGLNLGVEARHHFHHRFYASLRLAPVAEYAVMSLGDEYGYEYESSRLSDNNWAFGADASAGLAFRFAGSSDGRKRLPRGWLLLEGGGHLMSKHDVSLTPDGDGFQRPEPLELDSFTTSGAFVALSVMGTY